MDFKNQISLWKNKGAAPSKELEEGGFSPGYKPPAGVFNWFWHIVSGGIQELQNKLSAEENSRINENYYPEYTSDAIDENTKFYIDIANMGDGEGIYKRRARRIDNSSWKDLVSGQELKLSGENYQEDGIVSGGTSLSMPLDDYLCFNQSANFTIAFSVKLSETSETNDLITIGGTRKIVIQQKGADGIRLITFDDTDTMHVYPSDGCIMPKSYNKYHHYIVSMNIDTNVVRWFQDGLMESASSSEITNNNNFIKADGERSIKLFSDSQDKTGVQYIKILDYSVSISQAKKLFEKHSTIDYTNDKTQYDIKFKMLDSPIYEDAETRAQLTSGEQLSAALSKIKKWLTDLKAVAFSGNYNDLNGKPTAMRNPNALALNLNGTNTSYTGESSVSKTWYAPISAGTEGFNLVSSGSGAPVWQAPKYIFPRLEINAASGLNITVSNGSTSLNKTSTNSVLATTFNIPHFGEWTITAGDYKKVLNVDMSKVYKIQALTLESAAWEQIAEISESGKAQDIWSIGDEKNITAGDETLTIVIMDFNHDVKSDGFGMAGITFGLKNLMTDMRKMNITSANINTFTDTDMYEWLQGELLSSLPEELQGVLKFVNKQTYAGNNIGAINTESMKIFLFSEIEIFGKTTNSAKGEGRLYPYFATSALRTKYLSNGAGESESWWERSPWISSSAQFCNVTFAGTLNHDHASFEKGVCFGFCV